jgi:hypothetical protein
MDEYLLFLDESLAINPLKYFCLAGYIVNRDEYVNNLLPMVNRIKQKVFGRTDIIFHEKEIRAQSGNFGSFSDKATRELFWSGIHAILKDCDIYTVGAGVSTEIATAIYKSCFINSDYSIALHSLLKTMYIF